MGSGFLKKKKQAKMFQNQLASMQSQLDSLEATGNAGGGLVTVTLTGNNSMKSIKIKPECIDPEDAEGLEDLIRVAHEEARKELESQTQKQMGNMRGLSDLL